MKIFYILVAFYSDGGYSTAQLSTELGCQRAARLIVVSDFERLDRDERGDVIVPRCARVVTKRSLNSTAIGATTITGQTKGQTP